MTLTSHTSEHISGGDPTNYVRFLLALIIVAGLLFALKWALQWVAERQGIMAAKKSTASPRLQIVAQQAVDLKRRLVVAQWDDREFLLLLSPEQSLVVGEQVLAKKTSAKKS